MSPLPPLADFRASNAPAVVILGNDALLAARPATPVQLAHACLALGFRAVVPASWGDELVAGATLDALSGRATRPAIHCACPHVARRVLAVGSDLAAHLVSLVAPPVAAARYLRLHSSGELRVTYAGRCPAAADDSIDARLTPEELLAQLADRGIDLAEQPEVFESVIPPDRRRHLSLPGGLPSPEMLWSRDRFVVETMRGGDFASELADLVLARKDALIDPAAIVGCACSGAVRGVEPAEARMSVVALEPPRAAYPIVDDRGALSLELPLPAVARDAADLIAEWPARVGEPEHRVVSGPSAALGDAPPSPPLVPNRRPRLTPPGIAAVVAPPGAAAPTPSAAPRRRSPTGTPRVVPGSVPVSSDSEGRILPRAYVAHRRSPRSGIPAMSDPPVITPALPAPRHTVAASRDDETPRALSDSQRPVVRSVEPVAATTSTPAPVSPPGVRQAPGSTAGVVSIAAIGTFLGAQAVRGATLLRQRSWFVTAGALAGAGLLLGVAIGYSVAHRRPAGAPATERADRNADSAVGSAERAGGVRESVSAGGIAPVPDANRRAHPRTPQRSTARTTAPPTPSPAAPSPAAPVVVPSIVAAPESVSIRARRDSLVRADSLSAERESIRREIERRRSRLDSVERTRIRLDSIQRAEQAGSPPPQ